MNNKESTPKAAMKCFLDLTPFPFDDNGADKNVPSLIKRTPRDRAAEEHCS